MGDEKEHWGKIIVGPPPTKPEAEQFRIIDRFNLAYDALEVLAPAEREKVLEALRELLGLPEEGE